MGGIILLLVFVVGIISIPISLTIWFVSLRRVKDVSQRKSVESKSTTISFFVWLIIFFFPVDYGASGSNYQTWLNIWLIKTVLIIFTPSILALIISRKTLANAENTDSDHDSVHSYKTLAEAIAAQNTDTHSSDIQNNKHRKSKKRKISSLLKFTISILIIFICLLFYTDYAIKRDKPFSDFCLSLNAIDKFNDIKNTALSNGYHIIGDEHFLAISIDDSKGKKKACVVTNGYARIERIDQH